VSKNGNFLLNVGPKSDGTIPDPAREILLEIGNWLLKNGSAIYGTRPWKIYGEGPTKVAHGPFSEKEISYTGEDFRFTTKGDDLYAILMEKPTKGEVLIKSLSTNLTLYNKEVKKVEILGIGETGFERDEKGLKIQISDYDKLDYPLVFKIMG
jgi:alpha-L-fucosidase